MGTRKCCINECTSQEGEEKDTGVTFHRFPNNAIQREKWMKASKLETNFRPSKQTFVCSRHFKRENFTSQATGKFILKSGTVPSIFPWNKSTVVITKIISPAVSKPPSPQTVQIVEEKIKTEVTLPTEAVVVKPQEFATSVPDSPKKTNSVIKKRTPFKPILGRTKKASKRLSSKHELKVEPSTPERAKTAAEPPNGTPKKKNKVEKFIPGSSIEAQNFDGKWMQVKVIEVDMEEREVLVRSCDKNNKFKAGINDEWISMDSPRLRPVQPVLTFEVGEKVLARWNDCRKFPATIKRVLDNDAYDVLFDDGYPKIVRGIHINKYSAKNMPKLPYNEMAAPVVINHLLLNPPSLIPDYIKNMTDIPKAPTEGEWCCSWVDDIPVGQESSFDGPHGKLPSIIVPDWRVKEGWQKHIYLRQNGKWDVLFISPTNRKLRFKNELKIYLSEIGEVYDPEVWDFSMHKKRSKLIGLCKVSDQFKNPSMVQNYEGNQVLNQESNPYATLGALPYVQPNLVLPPPTQSEIRVGSLKVKVVDNIFQCPADACDKTFRKENHLQLHIKHYHEDLAKLMGECLNMEDLAYLRTTVDEVEVSPPKPQRKSHAPKPKLKMELNDSFREIQRKTPEVSSTEAKFLAQRSPILEEALKAPIITSMLGTTCKVERDVEIKNEPIAAGSFYSSSFDPESLIPPYSVIKSSNVKQQLGNRKRLRARFNPKPKTKAIKKRRFETYGTVMESIPLSSVQGIIPYHEGPYFKNQEKSYVDDNGEVIKIVRMKKEEIINCSCGYGEEDGLMIQCELCLCWQHGGCHGIENSQQVPDKYVCYICRNPYRQRKSQKYIHDQDWMIEGKLPVANYHMPNKKQKARFESLKQCHTLVGNLKEMKRFMSSLDVKINIAEKQGHPKLYLWAKKWEQSPPRNADNKEDVKRDINFEDDVKMCPIIPEPELAIEPAKCQQTLMDHIQYQQQAVKSRLETMEAEILALEENMAKVNGKAPVDDNKVKQTIFMLVNDLMKMNEISQIHRN